MLQIIKVGMSNPTEPIALNRHNFAQTGSGTKVDLKLVQNTVKSGFFRVYILLKHIKLGMIAPTGKWTGNVDFSGFTKYWFSTKLHFSNYFCSKNDSLIAFCIKIVGPYLYYTLYINLCIVDFAPLSYLRRLDSPYSTHRS